MKSHIIGFLLVTLAQIPMPIKIGTTFQNKLRPNTQPQAFKLVICDWVSPPSNWKSQPFLEVASGHGQQNDSVFKILFMFYARDVTPPKIPNSKVNSASLERDV